MSTPLPKSKSAQLAEMIRERIASGEWGKRMPAERALSEEYLVSRTTLRAALHILEKEMCLRTSSARRRGREIVGETRSHPKDSGTGHVLLLTPSLPGNPLLLEHIAVVRGMLAKASIDMEIKEATHLAAVKEPAPTIRRMATSRPGVAFVLHKMPVRVHRAFASLSLPVLIFGSTAPGVNLPTVDINFAATARHAFGRCLAANRERLAILVHRTPLAGDAIVLEEVVKAARARSLPPPKILRHDFHRERLIASVDQMLATPPLSRPNVVLVANQHHLLTLITHVQRRGMRIPEDLAVLYLGSDPVAERLSPIPDRYDSGAALPRTLAKSCVTLLSGATPPCSNILPRAIKGETMPPRAN